MADDYDGPCAGAPDTINGNGTITDGACAGRTITATGALSVTSGGAVSATSLSGATLTVQGSSVDVPSLSSAFGSVVVNATGGAATIGTINAVNGFFSVTASTSVTASGALFSSYGPSAITASNGAVLVKDVTVSIGQVTITSTAGAITTDNVTASYELNIKSNGAFAINTKTLTANNGYIKVDSGKTLTIVGLTKSTFYDIELKAENDLKTDIIEAGRNLSVTSTSGKVDTKDLTADQGTLKVKADNKITIVGITKTNKLDIDLDAKNIVKTNAITSGSHIRVNSTDENINITSTVDSNIDDTSGGNILLTAKKSIFTKSINTHSNTKPGSVRIVANKGDANTLFIVGTTATTNGVKGTITTNTVNGGGTNPTGFTFGISIQNGGTAMAAGGITVVAMGNLKVAASNSKAGTIILDAKNGTLTLPSGTMNANAASGKQAGSIVLLAKTVTTVSGTILSATQTSGAPGSGHSISIAAETLNLAGPTGLKIQTNGKGVAGFPALASLGPQGSTGVYSDDGSVFFLYWQLDNFASTFTVKPLTVAGAAPLTMISDGDESQVLASGHPLKFSNSALTLQSRGKLNHRVDVVFNGADDGTTNIMFDSTLSNVTLDANGVGGAGGKVTVYGDKIALNATVFNITANGPPSGNGNGGELYFRATAATLNPASKVTFKADAATVGSGNAIVGDVANSSVPKAITFFPGSVSFDIGTDIGQYSFSANGGKTGGNAGTIQISSPPVRIMTADAVTASALGGNGNGGEIYFYSYLQTINANATMSATGFGNGEGGKFTGVYGPYQFDINKVIKVDGGSTNTNQDGKIKLNQVTCQQWGTGFDWPKKYWSCTGANGNLEKTPANVATALSLKSLLQTRASQFYVFPMAADYNGFWQDFLDSTAGGFTFEALLNQTTTQYVYVTLFLQGNIGDNSLHSYSINQLTEITAHELGHFAEIYFLYPSSSATYANYTVRDLQNLDYVLDTTTFPNVYRKRLPCAPTPLTLGFSPDIPPFTLLTNTVSGNLICQGTNLNPVEFPSTPNSNSWILQSRDTGMWTGSKSPHEVIAQSFAYVEVGPLGARPYMDGIYSQSAPSLLGGHYFGCLKAWAAAQQAGNYGPSTNPDSCAIRDSWYTPFE